MTPRAAALIRAVQIYTDVSLSEGQALAVLQQVDAAGQQAFMKMWVSGEPVEIISGDRGTADRITDALGQTLFHEDRSADRVNEALKRAREP